MRKETEMIIPEVLIPAVIVPMLPPKAGCVNKPGCNNEITYVLPYMKLPK